MSRSKKLVALVVVLAVTLFTAGVTLVIALVEGSQNAISKVKVKYTVADVYIEMQANYYIGSTATAMKDDAGNTTITLSPLNMTGALNQVDLDNGAILSRENRKIIFEYIFINKSDKIPAIISQAKENDVPMVPVDKYNNVNITYTTSSTQLMQGALGDKTSFADTGLGLGETKYVYVIVEIKNGLYDVDFEGAFGWSLTQGTTVNSSTASSGGGKIINIDTSATGLVNGSDLSKINLVMGVENTEPTIYPMITDKCFVGWYTDSALNTKAEFPLLVTESTTLYPKNVDATSDLTYVYSSEYNGYLVGDGTNSYTGTATDIIIPDTHYTEANGEQIVNGFSSEALANNNNILSIMIPNTMHYLHTRMFSNSKNVSNLYVNASHPSIKSDGNCYISKRRIQNVLIGCKTAEIPNYVTGIGVGAFTDCTGLTDIKIPNSVTSIEQYAFYGCNNLTSVDMSRGVISIGQYAFQKCGFSEINIPDSVTTIGQQAFYNCTSLTKVTIGKGLKTYGTAVFASCKNLSSIVVDQNNATFKSENNCLINKINNNLILGCKTSTIPNSVTAIAGYAFYGSGLTSLFIPDSVVSISGQVFRDCTELVSISIGDGVKKIGLNVFKNCSKLTSVTFSNPTGWTVTTSSTATTGDAVTISTTDLSANATLLKTTHVSKYWNRA